MRIGCKSVSHDFKMKVCILYCWTEEIIHLHINTVLYSVQLTVVYCIFFIPELLLVTQKLKVHSNHVMSLYNQKGMCCLQDDLDFSIISSIICFYLVAVKLVRQALKLCRLLKLFYKCLKLLLVLTFFHYTVHEGLHFLSFNTTSSFAEHKDYFAYF